MRQLWLAFRRWWKHGPRYANFPCVTCGAMPSSFDIGLRTTRDSCVHFWTCRKCGKANSIANAAYHRFKLDQERQMFFFPWQYSWSRFIRQEGISTDETELSRP